ncbi:30S ribosomal protein THX [Aquimarina sp. W85]
MGKGDRKTKRGKIYLGSYGKLRPPRKKFKIKPTTLPHDPDKDLM